MANKRNEKKRRVLFTFNFFFFRGVVTLYFRHIRRQPTRQQELQIEQNRTYINITSKI